ncbi:MAG: phosphatidate cytidylyltransferase [Clostridia bacterium]|nr:phosphatidate cytidylyltransferase [Clostridia bacterium]
MKKRIYTSIAIVFTLVLLFILKAFVDNIFFDIFFIGLTAFAAFEISRILSKIGLYNFIYVAVAFPVLIGMTNLLGIKYIEKSGNNMLILWTVLIDLGLILLVSLLLFAFTLIFYKHTKEEMRVREITNMRVVKFAFKKALNTTIALVYPTFMFLFMLFINNFNRLGFVEFSNIGVNISIFMLITALAIPMLTDTFAMLTGSLIGGKKLCPKISPNKTISGSVGGTMWCILLSVVIYLFFTAFDSFADITNIIPIWQYIIVVLVCSVISQLGDLFESIMKRKAGVKDSGRFLPGHGGILDRIDSYIFVAPIVFFAFCMIAL